MMHTKPNKKWRTASISRDCFDCAKQQAEDHSEGRAIKIRRKASLIDLNGISPIYVCYDHAAKRGYQGRL